MLSFSADKEWKVQGRWAMKEKDLKDALLALGLRRGVITYEELNDAFPSEFFPVEETERFLRILKEFGVKVIENKDKSGAKSRHRCESA